MSRVGIVLSLTLTALVLVSCGAKSKSSSGLYQADGHRLYLSCSGSGKPTVVLEAGINADQSVWSKVTGKIASLHVRVCAYDRFGLGRSDGAKSALETRTVDAIDSDLHSLLRNAGLQPPYVLVAHSMGGLISRAYAQRYPGQVAGLVLLDTLPDDFAGFVRQETLQSGHESVDVSAASARLQLHDSVGSKPVVVIQAGNDSGLAKFIGSPPGFQTYWSAGQRTLARISSNSIFAVARGSTHEIQGDNPNLTVDAVGLVVDAVRKHSELPACSASALPADGGVCE